MANLRLIKPFLALSAALLLQSFCPLNTWAQPYTEINLSNPSQSELLTVPITQEQSKAYGWRPGQKIALKIYVENANGKKVILHDSKGSAHWKVVLNAKGEGAIVFLPNAKTFTGHLVVKGNDKLLYISTPYLGEAQGKTLEKVFEYRFKDGAGIKVHFTDQSLEAAGENEAFAKDTLDAAVQAYQTITEFKGFSTPGYSFAHPDVRYAEDPDRTIDIYLGNPNEKSALQFHGFTTAAFKDAPCFDTVKISETQYQAVILMPANYKEFIQKWERINPSSLGPRNINVDLRGTLIHEMLHTLIFFYNKNLNKQTSVQPNDAPHAVNLKKTDWYVEGLARYFETFAGARHDFFSQGFKQILPDKIRFSRGGSNYFMRYPDQPFTDLRYENALFWKFIDNRYGMNAIERLSREFRNYDSKSYRVTLEKVTGENFVQLLKEFALAILFKDMGLKEDAVYLKDVAKTHLIYRNGEMVLVAGSGEEKILGRVCRTDWVGEWESSEARFGSLAPIAGDSTEKSDVSGWATDFVQMDIAAQNKNLPWVGVALTNGGYTLAVQAVMVTKGGSRLKYDMAEIGQGQVQGLDLDKLAAKENLSVGDIDKVYLLITNTDPLSTADYEIRTRP